MRFLIAENADKSKKVATMTHRGFELLPELADHMTYEPQSCVSIYQFKVFQKGKWYLAELVQCVDDDSLIGFRFLEIILPEKQGK
jgi:hypothetical protein